MKPKYRIRAVQVDLARQMETIPFLKQYIDLIAEHHYNTLLLYLEWRIRTKTFDIGKADGYSGAELRELIDYAALRGINVIPGLATLGHAELLLKQKKFASYSELREGITGRFGNSFTPDFCPSLAKTRKFLTDYLAEVAAIFAETPYLHVGGDEVWDMAFCSQCRAKAPDFAGEQKLYLNHFKFIHQVVSKLGKRMMLWDDMFEYYPGILPELPRDIIMVNWQYQENVRGYQAHLCNLAFGEWFDRYDRLGFEYLIAPADFCWSNIATSTAHGDNFHSLGSLLTSWEKSASLLYKYFPVAAGAGQLWGGAAPDGDSAIALAVRQLFGVTDEPFVRAVAQYANAAHRIPNVKLQDLLTFDFFGPDNARLDALQTVTSALMPYSGALKDTRAEFILQDILSDCVLKILEERSKRACWCLLHGQESEAVDGLAKEVGEAGKKYAAFIVQHRRKNDAEKFQTMIETWQNALLEVQTSAKTKGMLTVLFALPEWFGVQKTRITVNGKSVADGVFKCEGKPFYERFFFLPKNTAVKTVQFESSGFGGQGIAYVSARTAKGKFVPDGITNITGTVENPGFLLTPNTNYAWFGNHDTLAGFHDRALAAAVHGMTLNMTGCGQDKTTVKSSAA